MFEGVGENNNKGTKRSWCNYGISFFNGSVIIGLIYVGQQVSEEIQDEIPVEVTFYGSTTSTTSTTSSRR